MAVKDWSTSASLNTQLGAVFIGEGMARADVNGAIRQQMADIRTRFQEDRSWKDDGAIGDASTVDSAAIQTSITAITAGRGAAFGPAGRYRLSTSLTHPSFVNLEGQSRAGTVIDNQNNALAMPLIVNSDPTAMIYSRLANMSLIGGTHGFKSTVSGETAACEFENLSVELHTTAAFEFNYLQTAKFNRVYMDGHGVAANGIVVTAGQNNHNHFEACDFLNYTGASLKMAAATNNIVDYCRFEGGGRASTTFTGSIATTTLTVTSAVPGSIVVGSAVVGAGVSPGTYVTAFGTGTGGTGTYTVSVSQTVASTTMTLPRATIDVTSAVNLRILNSFFEAGHDYLLNTALSDRGVTFDGNVFIGSNVGSGFQAGKFNCGNDLVYFGTNFFGLETTGPLNMFIWGDNPNLVGNSNVWTRRTASSGQFASRAVNVATAATFDLIRFSRAATSPNDTTNQQMLTGSLTVHFSGYDAGGLLRQISQRFHITVFAAGTGNVTIMTPVADTTSNNAGAITMTVQAKTGATASLGTLECVMANVNTGFASLVQWSFDYTCASTIQANRIQVAIG